MRVVVCTELGPPEKLVVEERPDLEPGPGQVAIAVRACGVNFVDTLMESGFKIENPNAATTCGCGNSFGA